MFQPIRFLEENRCPKCGHRIVLVDIDLTISGIEVDGSISHDFVKEGNVSYLYCNKCKNKYDFRKKGNYVRMKEKDQKPIIEEFNPFYA